MTTSAHADGSEHFGLEERNSLACPDDGDENGDRADGLAEKSGYVHGRSNRPVAWEAKTGFPNWNWSGKTAKNFLPNHATIRLSKCDVCDDGDRNDDPFGHEIWSESGGGDVLATESGHTDLEPIRQSPPPDQLRRAPAAPPGRQYRVMESLAYKLARVRPPTERAGYR